MRRVVQDHAYDDRLFAQFYDFIVERAGLQDLELEFWKAYAEYGGPILEMGCGTGRILLPLAERGYKVAGVDISPYMLEILEQKLNSARSEVRENVQLIESDMVNPGIEGEKFRLVIFCGAQFLHLKNDEQRLACLNSVRHLLDSNGVVVMSNSHLTKGDQPSFEAKPGKPEDKWGLQSRRKWDGPVYRHYFKLVSKTSKHQEYLFWWSLYPIEDNHMKRLIEQAGLECLIPSSELPDRDDSHIYVCKKPL